MLSVSVHIWIAQTFLNRMKIVLLLILSFLFSSALLIRIDWIGLDGRWCVCVCDDTMWVWCSTLYSVGCIFRNEFYKDSVFVNFIFKFENNESPPRMETTNAHNRIRRAQRLHWIWISFASEMVRLSLDVYHLSLAPSLALVSFLWFYLCHCSSAYTHTHKHTCSQI